MVVCLDRPESMVVGCGLLVTLKPGLVGSWSELNQCGLCMQHAGCAGLGAHCYVVSILALSCPLCVVSSSSAQGVMSRRCVGMCTLRGALRLLGEESYSVGSFTIAPHVVESARAPRQRLPV